MNQIKYTSNGIDTEYFFDFAFWSHADIVVSIDEKQLESDEYNINSNDPNPDTKIPILGGKITLRQAAPTGATIKIARVINLERTVAYQPTAPIDPVALNQDLNFMIAALRDFCARLCGLTDTVDNMDVPDNITEILTQIESLIDAVSNLENMDDFVRSAQLAAIKTEIENLRAEINAIEIPEIPDQPIDFVVEHSPPGANPWYRKYKSGWVEFTIVQTNVAATGTVNLPFTMQDVGYTVIAQILSSPSNTNATAIRDIVQEPNSFTFRHRGTAGNASGSNNVVQFTIAGYAALCDNE